MDLARKDEGLSDRVCARLAEIEADDLPASTVAAAKAVLLDATGVMLAASGMATEARPFIDLAAASGPGPASILGTGLTAPPAMAALANGSLAHALDYADTFDVVGGHPNASLVPALIALAQGCGPVSGKTFLAALVAGCELSCRLALALRQPLEAGGWYPPPIFAGMGAAAGAARLLGLDARGMRDALSLALCQVTMPGEIKHSPGSTIRAVREAFPAQGAVQSALLARAGVAGFERPLEGEAGFYALYAGGQFDAEVLLGKQDQAFCIERLTFKRWPCCRGTHAGIALALQYLAHGGDVGAIDTVTVEVDDVQHMLVEPLADKRRPANAANAKFSIPFTVALALARGGVGLTDFEDAALRDAEVLTLAEKVQFRVVSRDGSSRGVGGRLEVISQGRTVFDERIDHPPGSPSNPLAEIELVEKFTTNAALAQMPVAAVRMLDAILGIENASDVGSLFRIP